jgi:hypothetical protein
MKTTAKWGVRNAMAAIRAEPDWKKAHVGVVKDPSFPDPSETCGSCHEDIAEHYQSSLHISLSPFKKIIGTRANPEEGRAQKGRCRSRRPLHLLPQQLRTMSHKPPEAVEGGLLESHLFQKKAAHAYRMHRLPRQPHRKRVHGQEQRAFHRTSTRKILQMQQMPYGR